MSASRWSKFELILEITSKQGPVPLEYVWQRLVDWPSQSAWMLQTKVWSDPIADESNQRVGIGERIWAFTGPQADRYPSWKLGVLDEMVVVEWQPPTYCRVEHVGKIIRGIGDFKLEAQGTSVRFHWYEEIAGPRPILFLLRPAILIGAWISLRRFRREVLAGIFSKGSQID